MQSAEQVVNQVIELDRRAEDILSRAREEAESARRDARGRIAGDIEELEKRIAARIFDIEAEAARTRASEIAGVHREHADQVEAVGRISPDTMEHAVEMVLARLKGNAG